MNMVKALSKIFDENEAQEYIRIFFSDRGKNFTLRKWNHFGKRRTFLCIVCTKKLKQVFVKELSASQNTKYIDTLRLTARWTTFQLK